jgi:hypothetical protein
VEPSAAANRLRRGHRESLAAIDAGGRVSDVGIVAIAQGCWQLQHLDVSLTKGRITFVGITEIAERCRLLQHLDVSDTEGNISEAHIKAMTQLQHCAQLQYVIYTEDISAGVGITRLRELRSDEASQLTGG